MTEPIRSDVDYDVLENEAECFVDDKRAKRVTALWAEAAELVDTPSEITVGDDVGCRLYVGYHRTLSEMTLRRFVNLGRYVGSWPGLLNLEVDAAAEEAYMVFLFPARLLRDPKDLKKLIQKADEAVNRAYAGVP